MSKWLKKLSCVLALVLSLAGTAVTAYAHEAVDLERTDCSLTIVMKYDGQPMNGGNLTLYRVGDVTENNGDFIFSMKPEIDCQVDMEALQSEETAQAVSACVQQNHISGKTVTVGNNGTAVFEDLTVGLYLVRQETAAEGFSPIKPFLISLPQWDGEHYSYAVTAAAKTEPHKEPAPPDEPNTPYGPKLPQTGQLNWPVPVLLVLGGVLLFTGIVMRKKKDA